MERRLLQVKKVIADVKAEVQSLRTYNDLQESDHQQQQSGTEIGHVSSHSLSNIHSRYQKVLQVISDNCCSMANAFHLAGCPRSTMRDFVAIAELRDRGPSRTWSCYSWSYWLSKRVGSHLQNKTSVLQYLPVMANLWREGNRLPLKFDECIYIVQVMLFLP